MEMMDTDRASKEAHKRPYLAEIKSLRQDSRQDLDGGAARRGRAKKRAGAITDVAAYRRGRSHTHAAQSFDDKSEAVDGDEHTLDESKKFQTLPWNMKSKKMQGDQTEFLHQGWLYKTSRGITSHLTRGQHDHRQNRRFQLTEHSLEYSQLLQRVCNLYYYIMQVTRPKIYMHVHIAG